MERRKSPRGGVKPLGPTGFWGKGLTTQDIGLSTGIKEIPKSIGLDGVTPTEVSFDGSLSFESGIPNERVN